MAPRPQVGSPFWEVIAMFEHAFRRSLFSVVGFFVVIGLAASARAQNDAAVSPALPPHAAPRLAALPHQAEAPTQASMSAARALP